MNNMNNMNNINIINIIINININININTPPTTHNGNNNNNNNNDISSTSKQPRTITADEVPFFLSGFLVGSLRGPGRKHGTSVSGWSTAAGVPNRSPGPRTER